MGPSRISGVDRLHGEIVVTFKDLDEAREAGLDLRAYIRERMNNLERSLMTVAAEDHGYHELAYWK